MAETTKAPELDLDALFGNLTVVKSTEPMPAITRTRQSLPNKFGPSIHASISENSPMNVYFPPVAVNKAVSLIHAAAKAENVGVRVVVNCLRDKDGAIVKDKDGKVQYIAEKTGDYKGLVLIRYMGSPERKKAAAPRLFSIVKGEKDGTKSLKRRSDGVILATGTHDEMRAALAAAKAEAPSA